MFQLDDMETLLQLDYKLQHASKIGNLYNKSLAGFAVHISRTPSLIQVSDTTYELCLSLFHTCGKNIN